MEFLIDDILELRLSGAGINPESLKSSELAELISSYENALLHVIERDNPEVNLDSVFVSLVDIEQGSSRLLFKPNLKSLVFGAALTINTSLANNNTSNLPFKTVESLAKIWKFTKKRNCQAEFLNAHIKTGIIVPEIPIEISKDFYFEGETTIYGKIERVGGAQPKVRIRIDEENVLYLDVDEELAKTLANRLYEKVKLDGTAKWRKGDYKIHDFKIKDVSDFTGGKITDAFQELKGTVGKYYDDIDDVEKYFDNLRYDKDDY